ncbi:ribonuclease P protein component [Roseospira goensis]|uniref:Ribonuclease P protein component n=1 Tax=Roseospira goensis TaxID=391922 RepID=A0A7W6S0S6_9PROT|nr:ribonuclease P protein component [Roseospira goensis]MBB4286616.1 ribonuclease P protein component [Roseospira goensis]
MTAAERPDLPSPETAPPPPVERLKRRGDFLRVAGARIKWVTPGFILQAAPNPSARRVPGGAGALRPRLGFTVSRKVGNAVVRNRARRRLRAAADQVFPLAARPGWDYVLIGRQETNAQAFSTLLDDMRKALGRLPTSPARKGGGGDRAGRGRRGRGRS